MKELLMWFIVIVLVVGLVAFYLLKPKSAGRVAHDNRTKHVADLPSKVLIPSAIVNQPNIIVWEFQAPNLSTACEYARNNASVRKKAKDCAKLPLADCTSSTCICHYRPIYESRKNQRRHTQDRRNTFRFDNKEDRRHSEDRRMDQPDWHDKHIK
jgi:hypothetical protein